jgi:hypothetical protein
VWVGKGLGDGINYHDMIHTVVCIPDTAGQWHMHMASDQDMNTDQRSSKHCPQVFTAPDTSVLLGTSADLSGWRGILYPASHLLCQMLGVLQGRAPNLYCLLTRLVQSGAHSLCERQVVG